MKIQKLLFLALWISPHCNELFAAVDQPILDQKSILSKPQKKAELRSTEWKLLPTQKWEFDQHTSTLNIDKNGFSLNDLVSSKVKVYLHPKYIPSSKKLELLGKIIGSQSESRFLTQGDLALIRTKNTLQIGETYSVVEEDPIRLRSGKFKRGGLIYPILGKVKISGVQENLFIGTVTSTYKNFGRNTYLVPEASKILQPTPIPGPQPLRGVVMLDPNESTTFLAQHKEAFIDRGTEDGVQPGMIFRIYQTKDPVTNQEFSGSSFMIDADLLVTQVTATNSVAVVINSKRPLKEATDAVLLTDLTDLKSKTGFSAKGGDALDELDQLDHKDTLGSKENKVLRQLEKWKGAESMSQSVTPGPSSSPLPHLVPPVSPVPSEAKVSPSPLPVQAAPPLTDNQPPPPETLPQAPTHEAPVIPMTAPPPLTETQSVEAPAVIPLETLPTPPGTEPKTPTPSAQETQPSNPNQPPALPDLPAPPNS